MRTILVLTIFVIPYIFYAQDDLIKTRKKLALAGNVRSIDEKEYCTVNAPNETNNNKEGDQLRLKQEINYSFDINGLVNSISTRRDDHSQTTYIYTYTSLGKISEMKNSGLNRDTLIKISYTANNQEEERQVFVNNVLENKINLSYNEQGKILQVYSQDFKTKRKQKWIYKYLWNGKLESVSSFSNSVYVSETSFLYNTETRLIKEIQSFYDGSKIQKKITTSYDSGKKPVSEIIEFYENGFISSKKKCQFQNGLLVKETDYDMFNTIKKERLIKYNHFGSIESVQKFALNEHKKMVLIEAKTTSYNAQNNIIEEIETNYDFKGILKSSLTKKYTYKYDEKGNWIIKSEETGKQPVLITVRDIHYFGENPTGTITQQQAISFLDTLYNR